MCFPLYFQVVCIPGGDEEPVIGPVVDDIVVQVVPATACENVYYLIVGLRMRGLVELFFYKFLDDQGVELPKFLHGLKLQIYSAYLQVNPGQGFPILHYNF